MLLPQAIGQNRRQCDDPPNDGSSLARKHVLGNAVDDHEVVAQTVHFGKVEMHLLCVTPVESVPAATNWSALHAGEQGGFDYHPPLLLPLGYEYCSSKTSQNHRHLLNEPRVDHLLAKRARDLTQEVTSFTNRTNQIVSLWLTITRGNRHNILPSLVQCWTHQVIHRRINDGKVLCSVCFRNSTSEQNTGICCNRTAWFKISSRS